MTIIEAISMIDKLKPNSYGQTEKTMWLSTLDGLIMTQIIQTRKGAEEFSFSGYSEETPVTTSLIVPAPYDEIYLFWLEAKIDYYDREFAKYNNAMAMYTTAYEAFESYWFRTHRAIAGRRFLF